MKGWTVHDTLFRALIACLATCSAAYGAPIDNKGKPVPMAAPTAPVKLSGPNSPSPAKLPAATVTPLSVPITAIAENPTTRSTVTASGAVWNCAASQCSISAPLSFVAVDACHTLAQQVGRIRSFGTTASQLSATQLAQCNQSLVTLATSVRTEIPRVAAASGPVALEINYIAKPKTGMTMPGAPVPAGTGATPIAIEVNYIARPKTGLIPAAATTPPSGTGAAPIDIQVNYIARPKGR